MTLKVDIQYASQCDNLPTKSMISKWADAALSEDDARDVELSLRIVDEPESADLNKRYRKKSGATNVLSFPSEIPPDVNVGLLGDIVICAPVVNREAQEQGKSETAHWAHIVVHGVMHLRGYDHIKEQDAMRMEHMESRILTHLGFEDPYR